MENILTFLGVIAVYLGYYFSYKTIKSELGSDDESMSFASFVLWAILDFISAVALYIKHGNPLLTILFVVGSGTISLYLFKHNKRSWGKSDWFITFLVMLCCIVWYFSGEIHAIIASTMAVLLAGVPQLLSVLKNPDKKLLPIFISFTLGNIFFFLISLYSGKDLFDFNEFVKFYIVPTASGAMSIVYVLLSFRKAKHTPSYPYSLFI